jgi:predicted DNA-binding mobile mystery protein A
MNNSGKIREQVQETLKMGDFAAIRVRPNAGWIRTIRMALGMSGKQLAERIHVKPPRITELEKAETQGNITLRSLQRAAEAMGCEVIYALVPKVDLESILKGQAQIAAERNLQNVGHSMQLEKQGLSETENARQKASMVAEWVKDPPRWLWDLK